MRVLDTHTGQFKDVDPKRTKYAILSHTWDTELGEQTYQELREIQRQYTPSYDKSSSSDKDKSSPLRADTRTNSKPSSSGKPLLSPIWHDRKLSSKIRRACRVARDNGYDFLWIDSCCIDKQSSSELSESINSMYQWYTHAYVCYAFLPDVPAKEDHRKERSCFRGSRWFKRGWTLQELIAPLDVQFLSKEWMPIGSKESLAALVIEVTHIDHNALLNIEPLDEFSVAQRFSWAAERMATREEDRAYSLLGIFNINMPTLYGEGQNAFRRLQEEIMRRTPDQSLFAWSRCWYPGCHHGTHCFDSNTGIFQEPLYLLGTDVLKESLLAPSLDVFRGCTDITSLPHDEVANRLQLRTNQLSTPDYAFTSYGIRMQLPVIPVCDYCPSAHLNNLTEIPFSRWYLVVLGCGHKQFPGHVIARVCYIETSKSSLIEYFRSSRLKVQGETLDLLSLSPAIIARRHSLGKQLEIFIKTLYIPQPERDGVGAIARWREHKTIKLVLLEKACETLSAQGYNATLCSPDDAHPFTHSVTLSHETHTITIDYQHTLEHVQIGQQLIINAQVKISRPVPSTDPLGGVALVGNPIQLAKDHMPWEQELSFKGIELNTPSGPAAKLVVMLGLTLATTSCYILRIHLDIAKDIPVTDSKIAHA